MRRVNINNLVPGMIVEDNVHDHQGRFLLQGGQSLDQKHIRIFKIWGVTDVWIKDDHEEQPEEIVPEVPPEMYARAEGLLRRKFRTAVFNDPFEHELFRVCVNRKAQELMDNPAEEAANRLTLDRYQRAGKKKYVKRSKPVRLETLVSDRLKLGTLPDIYYRVIEAIHDPNLSLADISDIVSKDPTLSAKVLQLVNSSFYSLLKQVDTLTRALALIGTNQLMTIVTGVSVVSIFRNISSQILNMRMFWEHSVACGIVARLLASYLPGVVNSERYFVAGLLHDIGRLILVQTIPQEYEAVIALSGEHKASLQQTEQEILGFDHTKAGSLLAEKWNLPRSLENMIRYHHQPGEQEQNYDPMVVYMANHIVNALDIGSSGELYVPDFKPEIWEKLQLRETLLESLVQQMDYQLKDTVKLIYG